jgi:hypothetical protein
MQHFQKKARGHFIVKRLERVHGEAAVRHAYEAFEPIDTVATPAS